MKPENHAPPEENDAAKLEASGGRVPRLVVPLWSDPGDKAVCPSCGHKGEYYNGLPFVCESCEVGVDEEDQCHTPDCPCCATRPQCPECGSGMWHADTQAEYETGWPEPRASEIWHNAPAVATAPKDSD